MQTTGERANPPTLGAILAGGASRRFGSPKGAALLAGKTLLEHVLAAHRRALGHRVVMIGEASTAGAEVRTVHDRQPGRGPAGGIATALEVARHEGLAGVWVTPCDAPFVEPSLLDLLLSHAAECLAVIPRSAGPLGYEPLFGWYSTELEPIFRNALVAGPVSVHSVIESLPNPRYVDVTASTDMLFWNINTPEDLVAAERALKGGAS